MVPTGIENYVVLDLVGEGSFGKVSAKQHHTDPGNRSVCSMHTIARSFIIRVECCNTDC